MKEHSENSITLSYIRIGSGRKVALAFHGFGQDSSHFNCFEPVLGKEYTLYSFDLPWHGRENIKKTEKPADRNALKAFFLDFFESNDITKFLNIGYSIGAKISLILLDLFPDKTERLLLIAPDGFRTNFWFRLATGSRLTRSLFKYITYKPRFFFMFSDMMVRMKLVHPGVSRFAQSQMNTVSKREKVYFTWIFFRKLRSHKNRILKILVDFNIPISVFLGSDDKVIRPGQFKFLTEALPVSCKVTILDTGHNNLIGETARYLEKSQ